MSSFLRQLIVIVRPALVMAGVTLIVLALAYQVRSRIFVEIGSPRDDFFLYRFFEPEDQQPQTYRWTQGKARVELEGQQLAAPWTLTLRLNGYRPNRAARVQIQINGTVSETLRTTGDWKVYTVASDRAGDVWSGTTTLEFVSDTFVPQKFDANNPDMRHLGVAIDWMEWKPVRTAAALGTEDFWIEVGQAPLIPPIGIGLSWAVAVGILYASLRVIGVAARHVNIAFGGALVVIGFGFAFLRPFLATYTGALLALSVVVLVSSLLLLWLVPRLALHFGISLNPRERALLCAILLMCAGLKWGGAWYPHFRSSDLLFHAHRMAFVSQGNLFFTSELPDAARRVVPYPPALYVALAPIAPRIADAEGLVLIANVLFESVTLVVFYFTMRRVTVGSNGGVGSASAIAATFLLAFNPVSYWIYSWGNHTNIFGQAAATILFCLLLVSSPTRPRDFVMALFFLITASLAHLGVFLSLLVFIPLATAWRMLARDDKAKGEAVALPVLFLAGILCVWVLYYAEFGGLLLTQTSKFLGDLTSGQAAGVSGAIFGRFGDVVIQAGEQLGWILLGTGIVGIPLAWRILPTRARVIWGTWLLVALLFALVSLGAVFSTRYTMWAAPALALSGGLLLARLNESARVPRLAVYMLCALAMTQTLVLWIDRVVYGYQ